MIEIINDPNGIRSEALYYEISILVFFLIFLVLCIIFENKPVMAPGRTG